MAVTTACLITCLQLTALQLFHATSSQGGESAVATPQLVEGWPKNLQVGQVSAVAVNHLGQPVIFHRGSHRYDGPEFDENNVYKLQSAGPIDVDTILTLDPVTGTVLHGWGRDFFYLSHGLTIDHEGNYWITDVAMHQAFKFPANSTEPSLTFGERFIPGSDHTHLCKPTYIAVASSGEIFLSDGYCNARVLKYDRDGKFIRTFEDKRFSFNIPHKVILLEERNTICVADRENRRVVCLNAELAGREDGPDDWYSIQEPAWSRVFALTALGDTIYAVTGKPDPPTNLIGQGYTIDIAKRTVLDQWGKPGEPFQLPHDVCVSSDGKAIYVALIDPITVWKFEIKAANR